jgi:hypothetical protein
MVFYRCTAFNGNTAVGHQLGYVSNLRPNATAFNRTAIEGQGGRTASCEFDRIGHQ